MAPALKKLLVVPGMKGSGINYVYKYKIEYDKNNKGNVLDWGKV